MNRLGTRWLAAVLVLIGASGYGMLSPLIKLAYRDGWHNNAISAGQMFWGAVLMWTIVLLRPRSWSNPFRGPWVRLSLIGIFGLAMTTVVLNAALQRLDASFAVVLLFQFTWITLVVESVWHRRKPNRRQLMSILIIWIGTFLTAGFSATSLQGADLAGIGLGLLGALTYSLFIILTGRVPTGMDPLMRSSVMLTAALPIVFLLCPPQQLFGEGAGSLMVWGVLLGLLGQIIPTVCFNIGIPAIGGSLAAVLGSVELPVAVIAAQLLVGETIGPLRWIGILLILAGIIFAEMKSGESSNRTTQGESR